jgi:hypothetical protein
MYENKNILPITMNTNTIASSISPGNMPEELRSNSLEASLYPYDSPLKSTLLSLNKF